MENVSIGQYRSHDPPKHFALRIQFWKVTPGSVIPSAKFPTRGEPEPGQDSLELIEKSEESEERENVFIHWQEKLFSQKEFEHYDDPLNCVSSIEQKYHEDIQVLKRTHGERLGKRIFTYVDSDSFTITEELNHMTLSEHDESNVLIDKMSKLTYGNAGRRPYHVQPGGRRKRLVVNEPTEAIKNSRVITTPSKTMQIMVDIGSTDRNRLYVEDERMICSIKIDANGLIVINPDVNTGETFTVETYHDSRCVYQYTIEHASKQMTKQEKEQECHLFNELYTRHAQLMVSHVGNDLFPVPHKNELFVYSFFEIVSVKDFEYDSLFVEYCLELPSGWQCDTRQLSGVTQSCAMNEERVAMFCYPFDFHLLHTWPENHPEDFITWPVLYLQVYSLDSWQRHRIEGYGYCQVPDVAGTTCVEIDMWRPKGEGAFDEMRRYFIGGTPELKDFTYVKDPTNNEDSKLSKFYFKTVSTGKLILKLNTMFQTKISDADLSNASRKWKQAVKRTGGLAAAVDSLMQVLGAFHRARKRMLTAKSTLPVIT